MQRTDARSKNSTASKAMNRREFIAVGTLAGAALAIGCTKAHQGDWRFFMDDQARTVAAICDQVIPADDYPSASQAGVVSYIDLQLTRHFRRFQGTYREGIAKAEQACIRSFGKTLAEVTPAQQLAAVIALEREQGEFFSLIRTHTMQGYYGSPRHGGNRDAVSWRMLGVAEPPVRGRAQYRSGNGVAQ